jgi:ApaG protein
MQTAITNDVKIMVETAWQNERHAGLRQKFAFSYRITIENQGEQTVKLLRRHWYIVDSLDGKSEVEGEGVVGLQPMLEPGEKHQYVSGCILGSNMGKMYGTFLMERQIDGKLFEVKIPEFSLFVPYMNN